MDVDSSPRRRSGRPPKYDWSDKRDICYKLYVEEQKSAQEVHRYFLEHLNTAPDELPSTKGFLRQFQIWSFPHHTRKLETEDEARVLVRIKELWEQNVNQKDIKATLAQEGWDLRDYDFSKLWKKNGLRLRNETGYKLPDGQKKKRKRAPTAADDADTNGEDLTQELGLDASVQQSVAEDDEEEPIAAGLAPEEAELRRQRMSEIQAESDQRLETRKRRRRIRGYGHLPPDAPGTAPRFNSETSLDECKAYLELSNEMYANIRKDYEAICKEMNIIKKTQCADGVWDESKNRLIRQNLHLSAIMNSVQPNQEKKTIALDCLCSDVTKRMRVAGKSITVAEANNLLGFNPAESKAVRRAMYEIFAADNFESRLVCGEDKWQELRQKWFATDERLQQTVAENDPKLMKAVDLLCSDAMKRFREDKNKRGERQVVQRNAKYGPGPGPAWAASTPRSRKVDQETAAQDEMTMPLDQGQNSGARNTMGGQFYPLQGSGNLMPQMVQATANINFDLDPALSAPGPFYTEPSVQAIPAYFRLAPTSQWMDNHPKMWLGRLGSQSLSALHLAAISKAPVATVLKVHGLVKDDNGGEVSYLIESDEELQVYLADAGEKPIFSVALDGRYA